MIDSSVRSLIDRRLASSSVRLGMLGLLSADSDFRGVAVAVTVGLAGTEYLNCSARPWEDLEPLKYGRDARLALWSRNASGVLES
jgi:hypothetical protein